MTQVLLLRPWWLVALLPVLVLALWVRRRQLAGEWAGVIDPRLMPALRRLGLIADGRADPLAMLPFVAAAGLALALSGPAVLRPGAVVFRALDPLVLVLDLSPSVVADDAVLADLQAAAATMLGMAEGRPVGMMVYAADAYLASAPTSDAASLQGLIAVMAQDTMPVGGSRPDIALSMARDLFGGSDGPGQDGPGLGGADLVLVSDGGGAGLRAVEEAARLRTDGARVWTLALPRSSPGAPPPDLAGLAALARAGGGADLPAGQARALMARIAEARTARLIRDDTVGQGFRDFGPWLLVLPLLALFPLFRRRR
ncbi:MAG: VWA domain-containing protein [Gemmobacter sp.]